MCVIAVLLSLCDHAVHADLESKIKQPQRSSLLLLFFFSFSFFFFLFFLLLLDELAVKTLLSTTCSTHAETTKLTFTRLRQLKLDVDAKFDATIAESRQCVESADALVAMREVCC